MITLKPVQSTRSPVGLLPTISSGGQLCVYVMASPGLSVTQAQDAQKKNAFILYILSGSLIEFCGMA